MSRIMLGTEIRADAALCRNPLCRLRATERVVKSAIGREGRARAHCHRIASSFESKPFGRVARIFCDTSRASFASTVRARRKTIPVSSCPGGAMTDEPSTISSIAKPVTSDTSACILPHAAETTAPPRLCPINTRCGALSFSGYKVLSKPTRSSVRVDSVKSASLAEVVEPCPRTSNATTPASPDVCSRTSSANLAQESPEAPKPW